MLLSHSAGEADEEEGEEEEEEIERGGKEEERGGEGMTIYLVDTGPPQQDANPSEVLIGSGDPLIGGQPADQPETQLEADDWWDDANEAKTESWFNSIEDQIFLREMDR